MNIAFLEPLGVPEDALRAMTGPLRQAGHTLVFYPDRTTDAAEMIRRGKDCEALVIANTPFPAEVVSGCPRLRLLNVAFTGIDHVALAACRAQGVTVCNAAGYSDAAVAEMTLALTLSVLRRVPRGDRAAREGAALPAGREIAGKTVGVIGTGRIGLRVARLFQAFGARVIAFSRTVRPEAQAMGIAYLPLAQVLAQSDIVTLHVPGGDATRGMIGADELARMKKSAVLINCARGSVVHAAALRDALNSGRIAGAGVDVFDREPPLDESEPLLQARNCVLSPHMAFCTEEAMLRRAQIVVDNLTAFAAGQPRNVVG